ncbi:tetratricopeptide repeat protein [Escherichia coli]|uniref:tetratricopeptide repeat family protein n=2 Tax=Escherichia coli TaxID=562 RepID=UPI0005A72AEA|nr:tetratricopeptide repeat family protein [Escherichia coli]EFA6850633.1 tetratricopeptide repeat protein [Escherichia coli]EFB2664935.1 tetratricopeptide repeat protein [Escherichia coli]EFB3195310.1 tetratricopeptide repeat protein [Escherichia coli]EFD0408029.1 tetratricopeptide repeat protein [Escherichia coli]EGI1209394.1 tetratricopeptide repeat protein [Escherichia coli]
MTGKLRFEVNDNQGCFIFPETWFGSLLDEFEELIDAYDADEISETSYINKLRRLARQENDFIDVHAHLAYVFLEQNAPRKALNAALKGLAVGNRLIPEGFSGRIIWIHPDNRPFLRALYAAILANAHLQRHQDAIMLIEKILDYNPEDNHGARWLLGPELLRTGAHEQARHILQEHADEFSPYWYELGLLHFLNGELVKAATAFRRGFAANTYIAEILCGNLHPFPLAVWHNFSGGPDTAEDYYATYSPLWGQYPEALLFVNWLYNHSSVLHERAEIIKCAEMLMQEDDFKICESILRQQKLLRERIDETLSEEIVQKCRNINGEYVWPWILPFSAAGMKHSSIQHQ